MKLFKLKLLFKLLFCFVFILSKFIRINYNYNNIIEMFQILWYMECVAHIISHVLKQVVHSVMYFLTCNNYIYFWIDWGHTVLTKWIIWPNMIWSDVLPNLIPNEYWSIVKSIKPPPILYRAIVLRTCVHDKDCYLTNYIAQPPPGPKFPLRVNESIQNGGPSFVTQTSRTHNQP